MQSSTLKAIINSFNATSDDATRYNMLFVRLTAKGNNIVLEACDGLILSTVSVEDEDLAKLVGEKEYAVSTDALKVLKLLAKERLPGLTEVLEGDNITFSFAGMSVSIGTAKSQNIEFPAFEQVRPKRAPEAFAVGLNPELLMSLFKAMNEEKRNVLCTLVFGESPIDPIVVHVGEQQGVLMSARTDKAIEAERVRDSIAEAAATAKMKVGA